MKHKVLIIEDVPEMAELIRTTLEGVSGVEARVVHTVLEGRRCILKDRPDWVLLDEIVPGESPHDLLVEPAMEGIKVILITAAYQPDKPLPRGALMRMAKWSWKDMLPVRARIAELLNRG